jgi:hypothetical protein
MQKTAVKLPSVRVEPIARKARSSTSLQWASFVSGFKISVNLPVRSSKFVACFAASASSAF